MKNRNRQKIVIPEAFRIVVTTQDGLEHTFERARAWTVQFWGVFSITKENGEVMLYGSGIWRSATVNALAPQVV